MNKWLRMLNSIQWKLVIIYILLILIAMQLIGVYFFRQLEQYYERSFRDTLNNQANLIQAQIQRQNDLARVLSDPRMDEDDKRKQIDKVLESLFILNKNNTLQIVDQEGIVISTTSNEKKQVGKKNIKVNKVLQGTLSTEQQIQRDSSGKRIMTVSYALKQSNGQTIGAVYIEAPMEDMYLNIREINWILIRITMAALIGTALLNILLARTITNPVKEITEQATIMAEGDFNRKVNVKSQDEIGQLGAAFNYLTQRLQEALSQNEEEKRKLESVLLNMSDGVIATDRNGRVIVTNHRAGEILDRPVKEGSQINQVLPLSQPITLPLEEERETYLELTPTDEEEPTIVKLSFTPIKRPDEETVGLITVLQDVTEEEKLERQRKEFVANVSHELRTPLTTIKSYLEALDEGGAMEDPELASRFLRVTRGEADRMTRLINDLLQLSRMDAKNTRFNKQSISLKDVLEDVADRFSVQCKQKEISFRLNVPEHLPRIYADRDQIDQVLDNLLSNAVKYTPEGRSITVSAQRRSDGFVAVSVADTGIGIPKKDLDRIFERFYRVDKARSRSMGGTGLGLSIAREIVKAHGGEIHMDSEYGKGTTVTFSLPPCEPEVVG
jgi:two-component system, OmpR family, sensor histidine kinase VicK